MSVYEIITLIDTLNNNNTLTNLQFNTSSVTGIIYIINNLKNKTLKKINIESSIKISLSDGEIIDFIENTSLEEFNVGNISIHERTHTYDSHMYVQYHLMKNNILNMSYKQLKLPKCIVKMILEYVDKHKRNNVLDIMVKYTNTKKSPYSHYFY